MPAPIEPWQLQPWARAWAWMLPPCERGYTSTLPGDYLRPPVRCPGRLQQARGVATTGAPMRETRHRGSTLEYLTLFPDGFQEEAAYPIVICLHGYGACMDDLTGLAQAIDPNGY